MEVFSSHCKCFYFLLCNISMVWIPGFWHQRFIRWRRKGKSNGKGVFLRNVSMYVHRRRVPHHREGKQILSMLVAMRNAKKVDRQIDRRWKRNTAISLSPSPPGSFVLYVCDDAYGQPYTRKSHAFPMTTYLSNLFLELCYTLLPV